jgi:hypothetical protein
MIQIVWKALRASGVFRFSGNRLLSFAVTFFGFCVVGQALGEEMKKEKTTQGSVGHCEGD